MRHLRIVLALVILASSAAGCRRSEPDLGYSYHKGEISQEMLLQDEATLRRTPGITRVIATHHSDGSADLDIAVDNDHTMAVQQKLSAMGYVKGRH